MSLDPRILVFFLALGLFLIVGRWMMALAAGLHPRIVDLELAARREDVRLLLRTWTEEEHSRAAQILVLDFLLLMGYGAGGAAMASLLDEYAAKQGWWLAGMSGAVAIAFVAGALCDAAENVLALLMMARQDPGRLLPAMTAFFSLSKFALVALALIYPVALFVRLEVAAVTPVVRWLVTAALKLWAGAVGGT